MKLRPGRPEDAAALGALWFESWMSTDPDTPAVTAADLAERAHAELSGRWEVTVVEADGGMLGFLALAPEERRLDQIFVLPRAQGRGIGARLLDLAKRRLPDGFWLRADATNHHARRFYEREGLKWVRTEMEGSRERVVYAFEPAGRGR
jgi:putative acetyltransferase